MKKLMKIGCGGIVALFGLLLVIALIGGGDDSNKTTNNDTKNNESTNNDNQQTAESQEEETPATYGIGTPVTVGDAIFTVNSFSTAAQVGPSVLPQVANGLYLVVNVTYKNNGNEAVTIDSSFFKLKRGEKTYEADSMGSMSANQSSDGNIQNSFFMQEVNPDMQISGNVVFDLAPEVAQATDLQLQVQTGFWGTETEEINLQ